LFGVFADIHQRAAEKGIGHGRHGDEEVVGKVETVHGAGF
jgi:hypothetical protein